MGREAEKQDSVESLRMDRKIPSLSWGYHKGSGNDDGTMGRREPAATAIYNASLHVTFAKKIYLVHSLDE